MAGELESDSVALERVREYEDLPQVNLSLTCSMTTIMLRNGNVTGGRLGISGATGRALAVHG